MAIDKVCKNSALSSSGSASIMTFKCSTVRPHRSCVIWVSIVGLLGGLLTVLFFSYSVNTDHLTGSISFTDTSTGSNIKLAVGHLNLSTLVYHQQDIQLLDDSQSKNHYIFHAGRNSPGGNIIKQMYNTTQLSIEDLMIECERTLGCVGFTPDGVLKRLILPYNNWTSTTSGIYTLDSNYCELKEGHSCNRNTTCLDTVDGTYSCIPTTPITTDHPNNRHTSKESSASIYTDSSHLSSSIHIVVSADLSVLDGLVAMIQSVIKHANSKDDTVIHIVVNSTNRQPIENRLTCSLSIPHNVQLDFVSFDLSENFTKLIHVKEKLQYLANPSNFARFFFEQLLPDLPYVLYLDVDVIVQHDIGVLWRNVIKSSALLTVVPRNTISCSKSFADSMVDLYRKRFGKDLTKMKCPNFNAGVVGFNLDKWRKDNVKDEIEYWMEQNSKEQLWGLGTQPVLHVISVGDYKLVDRRWNVEGLGHLKVSASQVRRGYILHWNGTDKPWGKRFGTNAKRRGWLTVNDHIWRKYYKEECNKKGKCVLDATNGTAHCVCKSGYKGKLCSHK